MIDLAKATPWDKRQARAYAEQQADQAGREAFDKARDLRLDDPQRFAAHKAAYDRAYQQAYEGYLTTVITQELEDRQRQILNAMSNTRQ